MKLLPPTKIDPHCANYCQATYKQNTIHMNANGSEHEEFSSTVAAVLRTHLNSFWLKVVHVYLDIAVCRATRKQAVNRQPFL